MKEKKYLLLGIFFVILFFKYNSIQSEEINILSKVSYKKITVNTLQDLSRKDDSKELFVFSIGKLDLRKLSIQKKKETFVQLLLPAIKVVHEEVKNNKRIIEKLKNKSILSKKEKKYSETLFTKYRVSYGNWAELDSKLILYPTSIILAQGAIESAWGTSRFFREGNNIFGMWSTNPKEPRIAAGKRRSDGFLPHLKKYDTIKDSVSDLVLNISRNNAYKQVRTLYNKDKSPDVIVGGLIKYSEEGTKYIKKVRTTMKSNDFEKYD